MSEETLSEGQHFLKNLSNTEKLPRLFGYPDYSSRLKISVIFALIFCTTHQKWRWCLHADSGSRGRTNSEGRFKTFGDLRCEAKIWRPRSHQCRRQWRGLSFLETLTTSRRQTKYLSYYTSPNTVEGRSPRDTKCHLLSQHLIREDLKYSSPSV